MAIFEGLSDPHGSVLLGWVEPGVFYARFEQTISAELGVRFAARFTSLIGDSVCVRYFTDSSRVVSYDMQAMAAVVDAALTMKRHFQLIVARPWQGVVGERALRFAAAFQCMEYVTSEEAFDARLRAAAPTSSHQILQLGGAAIEASDAGPRPQPFTYVFDLSQFERGAFVATRWRHLSMRPNDGWVCIARDDEQALRLARQAALGEWAQPLSRQPEDFTVQFNDVDAHPAPSSEPS
jgi:hypothetical protein